MSVRRQRSSVLQQSCTGLLLLALSLTVSVVATGTAASAATAITPHGATSTSYASSSTTAFTLVVPATARAGDVLVASIGLGSTSTTAQPTLSTPAGWTLVTRTNRSSDGALAIYSHVLVGGETSYTWTTNTPVGGTAHLAAFGGVDATRPIDASAGRTAGKGNSLSTPSISTSSAGDTLVSSFYGYQASGSGNVWSVPTGMTELGDVSNGPRSGSQDQGAQPAAGSSGAKKATASKKFSYGIAALTALRPATVVTPPPVITAVGTGGITTGSATISWTTDQPADGQVAYGTTTSYGLTTTLAATLSTAHAQSLTGLAAGTTYHYRVTSRNAAGKTSTNADSTFQTASGGGGGPVPVIVDTDIFSDADDVGALATAFGMQLHGEAQVIAIGVDTRTSRPSVATSSWRCAAAVAQFYGFGGIPIGTTMPNNGTQANAPDFTGPCAQLASPSTPAPGRAVDVFRRALASQPDGSVVMIGTGYFGNFAALLASPADGLSPLTGRDLIARKVKSLTVMGGGFPSRGGENNLIGDPASAQAVASGWPSRLVWSGYEVGDLIHTGNTISSVHPTTSPVRVAYEAFVRPGNWIYSYDLTSVYHAIRPGDPLLTEVGPGTNAVDNLGGNSFAPGAGNQYYLRLSDAVALDSQIESLLDRLPTGSPPDTKPPTISGVNAGAPTATGTTVSWTTDEASTSQVDVGLTTAYGATTALDPSLTLSHAQSLTGLAPSTLYHYRVRSSDAAGNLATSPDLTFTTAAAPGPATGPNDTFDTNTINPTRWVVTPSGSTVAAANQELEITHPAGGWTKGTISTTGAYDHTGKATQVQMRRAANNGVGGSSYGETSVFLWLDATHYASFFTAGGGIVALVNTGSGEVNLTPGWPAYSPATMQWLRFRESGGTLYWEYAAGSTSPGPWTVLASAPDPFPMRAVTFVITAGSNSATADTASFDDISTY